MHGWHKRMGSFRSHANLRGTCIGRCSLLHHLSLPFVSRSPLPLYVMSARLRECLPWVMQPLISFSHACTFIIFPSYPRAFVGLLPPSDAFIHMLDGVCPPNQLSGSVPLSSTGMGRKVVPRIWWIFFSDIAFCLDLPENCSQPTDHLFAKPCTSFCCVTHPPPRPFFFFPSPWGTPSPSAKPASLVPPPPASSPSFLP